MWRPIPTVSILTSFGAAWISFAFFASRAEMAGSQLLFWLGMTLLLLPSIYWMASRDIERHERLGILLVLGLALYLVKIMYSPLMFTFLDELQHWRTAHDMLTSGRLFEDNPILSVSPFFPGLEIVTHALASLSGLSIYQAGNVVVGVARVVLVLALFLLSERVSGSQHVAGWATLIYMANPHFLLFDAQFGYESLALPLAVLTIYIAVRYSQAKETELGGRGGLRILMFLGVAVMVVTHHVTSLLLAVFFLLWAAVRFLRGHQVITRLVPAWIGVVGLIGILIWLVFIATNALDYLTPPVTRAVRELIQLIAGERSPRTLFVHEGSDGVSQAASLWLRYAGISAILIVLLSLPYGLLQIWKRYRNSSIILTLGLVALAYPVTLAFRYIPWGLVVASRTAPYVFLGVSFVLAVGYANLTVPVRLTPRLPAAFTAWALAIFIGMIASAVAAWGLPVIYRVDSYTNSVDRQSLAAANWARYVLGPGNRFAAEHAMLWVLGSYGWQRSVTPDVDRIWVDPVFDTTDLEQDHLHILRRGQIRYLAIDRRVGSELLVDLPAFAATRPEVFLTGAQPAGPLPAAEQGPRTSAEVPPLWSTFDRLDSISRVYDNGDIVIYDIGALTREE